MGTSAEGMDSRTEMEEAEGDDTKGSGGKEDTSKKAEVRV